MPAFGHRERQGVHNARKVSDRMLTSEMIKKAALAAGADKCGIAPMSRFDGAPDEMNPQFLFPEAKSCIGFVFRIPRGVQRGIEEGTQFYQYPSMAYGGINEIFAPAVLYHVGKVIEDEGYEAFVLLDGSAVLYTENEKIQMQKCTLYNIPKGEWHHITVSENATVMVAENSNTSRDNTEKKLLK